MLSYTANVCEMPSLLTYIDSLERHKIIILNIKRRVEKEPRQCVFLIIKIIRPVEKKKLPRICMEHRENIDILSHARNIRLL